MSVMGSRLIVVVALVSALTLNKGEPVAVCRERMKGGVRPLESRVKAPLAEVTAVREAQVASFNVTVSAASGLPEAATPETRAD